MIIVYTGNGKGKTTAALGLALRAVGWGKKVLVIQFLKKQVSGEVKLIKKLGIRNWELEQYGTKDFVNPKRLKPVDYEEANRALASAMLHVMSSMFDMVILDEVNVAVEFGLIKPDQILELVRIAKRIGVDLVLTGRFACPEIIRKADLVTEFTEVSHPFQKGEKARKGIDY